MTANTGSSLIDFVLISRVYVDQLYTHKKFRNTRLAITIGGQVTA